MNDTAPGPGSVALVTGATSGIGLEIARQLLDAGLIVHVAGRDPDRLRAAIDELSASGDRARPLQLEVTDQDSIAAAAASVDALDVLVNNAGINPGGADPLGGPLDDFRRAYETNVFAVVAVTAAFLPALRRSPHPRIVNVSSGTASLTWTTSDNPQFDWRAVQGGGTAYRSSKTALNAVTLHTAQALAAEGSGARVNALAPGLRRTNLLPGMSRGGDPAEAAAGAVRLALLPDDGPTGGFFSWDGTPVPW
ncbi:SDR family NAD(P)-dependent oxidoreductase [Amnibacterium sp.]|uniref:SDR family NAD(P)-dependent oxidoreductase n=1 Tax=Amnibacterium sp. TaxID=1872496 RepID=UPI003F7C3DAF